MASTSQEQALYEVSQILQGDDEARHRFEQHVLRSVVRIDISDTWRYNTSGDKVCINFSAHFQFARRLEYAMLREIVGLGQLRYCIVYRGRFSLYP